MISIIVIGRNESWRLTKCLNSISILIEKCSKIAFEVIYVDSSSTDDSIERAKLLNNIKIYKLTGDMNAAIARNVGARESIGDILYFVDGDMELNSNFLRYALNQKNELISDVVTGHLDDYLYDTKDVFLGCFPRTYSRSIPENVQVLKTNGGIFLIKRKIWTHVVGMRTKYKVNEDIDLSIRLSKLNITTKRIPHLITNHHTVDYHDENRMWKMLKAGYGLYPGLILRDHFLVLNVWKRVIRSQYTALLIMIVLLATLVNIHLFLTALIGYIILLTARVIKHSRSIGNEKNKIKYFIERLTLQFALDISFWLGFLLFYPKTKKHTYTKI